MNAAVPEWSELERLLARKEALQRIESSDPALAARIRELRAWQAARLARTYDDLAHEERQAPAIEFFLTDIYGPQDFSRRDRELSRAWAHLRRALPHAALRVLAEAIELDVLSAELDHAVARQLAPGRISSARYAEAYRAAGRPADRKRQIELIVRIGAELERAVSHRLTGLALRAAHVPARIAGFGTLQDFLERGFAAFRRLSGASAFLEAVRSREAALSEAIFQGDVDPFAALPSLSGSPGARRGP